MMTVIWALKNYRNLSLAKGVVQPFRLSSSISMWIRGIVHGNYLS